VNIFVDAISNSEKNEELAIRLLNIKNEFLYSLYSNVCISLFEKDKLLFSFSMAIKLIEF
jgi:dynein heavy chain